MLHVALALLVVAGFIGFDSMPFWIIGAWALGLAYLIFFLARAARREYLR